MSLTIILSLWFSVFDDIINAIAQIAGGFDRLTVSLFVLLYECARGAALTCVPPFPFV